MPTKRFSCSLRNLEGICDYVTHFANQAGLNEAEVYAVQLAVDEASTNIMDEVTYVADPEKGNTLTMIKHHSQ